MLIVCFVADFIYRVQTAAAAARAVSYTHAHTHTICIGDDATVHDDRWKRTAGRALCGGRRRRRRRRLRRRGNLAEIYRRRRQTVEFSHLGAVLEAD